MKTNYMKQLLNKYGRNNEIKTCDNCRWVGCNNYGRNLPACTKHILESNK